MSTKLKFHFAINHGRVQQSGQAMMLTVMFFLIVSLVIVSGSTAVTMNETKINRNIADSKKSYFVSEAGLEDLAYRVLKNKIYDDTEVLSLAGHVATTTVVTSGAEREIVATSSVSNLVRKTRLRLSTGAGASFFYGVQAGEGGFIMENSSFISGNVFSNGPITGQNSNLTQGDVISAGPNGLISGIHTEGSAYANTISNSSIDGDAYYVNISGSTVGGTLYPGSENQATGTLPITEEMIGEWEAAAAAGGEINSPCPYKIKTDTTIGPIKINCDLEISGTPVITIAGPIWVSGNINFENSSVVKLHSSMGRSSVAIIADNQSNRLTSSKIELQNSAQFQNSGTEGSYILILSQNNSAENGGGEKAIILKNSANGDVLVYAGHGEIELQSSVDLKEVTAYRIRIKNSAQIIYESGLANILFTSGPSGGYSISDWKEIK
ncbi:TPA: hypothetical protein DEW47_01725 [Patescibacteria group bacterium]|nr:MAG: hypothetical protein UT71_C0009G0020 [Parcubacteria group bacterium GW2011_GWF2_40_10]KKR47451.1 MAG: hypothetical protein UT83_C0009G0017 [Parcubacteria group bacterium GW2011_GWA2_40_143]KKR59872.1 MAG: hypothetical protein UT97_C0009G0017 [Parcubacteria group bacterium GW2011_GWC2_40_31]KKR81879.1 MAG: hypothetical protein UU28_C0018G0017 [Parcubacteria group bacterium GW2011_GWD2_40_9]HBB56599.1 hypothetical protein [Patescibacteria group bacterium]